MLINFGFVKNRWCDFGTSKAAVSKYVPGPSGVPETLSSEVKII